MEAGTTVQGHLKESRNKSFGRSILKFWPLYVMLLPCIIYYILICYVPMSGITLAFKDYSFRKGIWGSPWVGFRYFKTFFTSYDCFRLLRNTLTVGFIKCILEFPFAIFLALMLNEVRNMKFKKVSQTITYLPHFLSSVIIITMIQRILAPNTGVINQIIGQLGGDPGTFFLMDAKYFFQILFSMDLWRNIGWDSIIYLAAISGVDVALYEAADMDGASKLKKMWHITLPNVGASFGLSACVFFGFMLTDLDPVSDFGESRPGASSSTTYKRSIEIATQYPHTYKVVPGLNAPAYLSSDSMKDVKSQMDLLNYKEMLVQAIFASTDEEVKKIVESFRELLKAAGNDKFEDYLKQLYDQDKSTINFYTK